MNTRRGIGNLMMTASPPIRSLRPAGVQNLSPPSQNPKNGENQPSREQIVSDDGKGLSTQAQQYEATAYMINEVRREVDIWRREPNPNNWKVTPETARLLKHWRHHQFQGIRPFFCQVEAIETAHLAYRSGPQIG